MTNKLYYFAHPYTALDKQGNISFVGQEVNFNLCCMRVNELLARRYFVYSPITHSHPLHVRNPEWLKNEEYEFWITYDKLIMEKCQFDGIILAPGWEKSRGCVEEKKIFQKKGLEILLYEEIIKNLR